MLSWALLSLPIRAEPLMNNKCDTNYLTSSGVPRGVVWGVQTPPRNSEVIGEVLDRVSKKNRRLDFLL